MQGLWQSLFKQRMRLPRQGFAFPRNDGYRRFYYLKLFTIAFATACFAGFVGDDVLTIWGDFSIIGGVVLSNASHTSTRTSAGSAYHSVSRSEGYKIYTCFLKSILFYIFL